ncbi:VOC family protein [Roseateles sp. L2-2]|uniref:VOC family protein n=1 Tax=Roseateles sp. L2-2 TaxID=3422597 RepID=UPI003D35DF22
MFSHLFVGITDFDRALAFYTPVMAALKQPHRFTDPKSERAGWQSAQTVRPLFLIGRPLEGEACFGNGQMTAFMAASRAMVDEVHAAALAHGGTCEGEPGLRPQYHPNYYGAYFRDPDGNKLCVVCHEAEPLPSEGA